jgi:hypothetical protein
MEIDQQLKLAQFGIVCLTPENLQSSPWMFFEAGALSKSLTKPTYVCPYLLDLEPNDVKGPLVQFQMAKANKEGTKKLVNAIKTFIEVEGPQRLSLERKFENYWYKLESSLGSIPKPIKAIEGEWLWADGQKITIYSFGSCKSIRNDHEFNSGTWKQFDSDKCVFILDWKSKKATDILKLSSDFLSLEGCNTEGGYITATRKREND